MKYFTGSASCHVGPQIGSLEDGLRLVTAVSDHCLWEWDLASGKVSRSDEMAAQFGYEPTQISDDTLWWRDRIHPEDRERTCDSIDRAIAVNRCGSWTSFYRFLRRDGIYAAVCDHAFILKDGSGIANRLVGAVMDLSRIHQAYRTLQEREEWYRYTIELTGQIAWSTTADGLVINLGDRWSSLTGAKSEMFASEWERVAHPADLPKTQEHWAKSIETGEPLDLEQRLKMLDGTYRWFRTRAAPHKNQLGRVARWYGTIEDIHDLKASQLALARLANFDELTTFPNRHMFSDDLETVLSRAIRAGTRAALLLIDLDDFKSVNDLHGHSTGDLLLMSFARRMLGSGIQLYRIGGDEFAAIMQDGVDEGSAVDLAARIHSLLEEPFELADAVFDCRASIGRAIFPRHGNDATELLKSADIALYAAKDAGRSQTKVFESAMRSDLQRRSSMLAVARQGLDADMIEPFFQPKVSLADGKIAGFEALLRIRNSRFGAQAPSVIGAAFDHPELCLAIAERMLTNIISVTKDWRSKDLEFGRIAINASPLEFRRGNYADLLLARLEAENVPAQDIEIEVTEDVFLERGDGPVLECLLKLKAAGVTIALDDFGTGYASLTHLRHFPVDVLKIDQSFIRDLTTNSRQEQITKGLIKLSRTIGIQTVAEGVETVAQAELLQSFGCGLAQGFLFGRPTTVQDAEILLRGRSSASHTDLARELRTA